MLNILGSKIDLCDGLSRRNFLQIGSLAMGGLTLPQLLGVEAQEGIRNSRKAVIMIYMVGAPPHQDMYDLKMDAPAEIRGEFQPIETSVPGIRISEYMPGIAGIMDKCVPLRSVHGSPNGSHDSYICYTGRAKRNEPTGGWPSMGSMISRLRGAARPDAPPFIGLAPNAGHPPYGSPGLPGFLGVRDAAFRPSGPASKDMVLNSITPERLGGRRSLLEGFDSFRRRMDQESIYAGLDEVTKQALGILTSSRLAGARDISREPESVRERYGKGSPDRYGDGAPRNLEQFLMARRLIEAGVRVVTLNFGRWDFHSNNHSELKNTHLPWFDQGLSALIDDIYQRGMADDVAVVAWGEFGRTPQINKNAGRDHWPKLSTAVLACGGMKHGQVIGASDWQAAEATDRPVHFGDVFAT
ncbi:MAG: DUF1501 domain-containing protein, partial [Pirellulaceae bacterium]|nr:DUF1501 domain-containing protein [Pirellulaceae bacterium]